MTASGITTAALSAVPERNEWSSNATRNLLEAIAQTGQMVGATILIGGLLGLVLGITLFATRKGGILPNRTIYTIGNLLVNFIRPIPFIIFITAVRPLTVAVMHATIGTKAVTFPMIIACAMATSRIVEQNLIDSDPGVIEAGRAMGASRLHILFRILIPEALAPLILGYTYLFVGVVDLSAMAGAIGGGGLGSFALREGFARYNDYVTWAAVGVIIVIVQVVQQLGNTLARAVLRR
ncbi:MAG: ABC transporter permease subunit [Bifidobacteriaceae bacterium]|jgi:D-methionine transport system permease protein|nr:ABC transporter permease subunit [Bifidobacteriaceae bacterium]